MRAIASCPRCGSPIPATAPGGECPACLVRLACAPAVPPRPPFTPAELQAHFADLEVLSLIGTGGMGAVYKVRNHALARTAAMKVLAPDQAEDPEAAERFLREAQAQARLSHPHIVGVYDFGRSGGIVFLLMEYVDGVTLRDLLRTGRPTPAESLRLIGQVCDALQYAHDQKVVHRDIKPENVLVDRAGNVKIADFGLAKVGDGERFRLTQAGDRMGTARYMAPEQWDDTAGVDHRADLYSVGVLFYELLTGDLPTPQFTPPSAKAGTDRRLDRVVSKSLRDEPAERYQQAAELRSAVDRAAARRRPWGWLVGSAGVCAAAAAVALTLSLGSANRVSQPELTVPNLKPAEPVNFVWDPPVNLGPGVNSPASEGSPCPSADGLTLWFHSDRPDGSGQADLYVARRLSRDEPFGPAVNLGPGVNGPAAESDPCVSADGLTLVFVSGRRGGVGAIDLWMCRRPDPAADWGDPTNLGPDVNSFSNEYRPWLSADGLALTFISQRPPEHTVWISRRATPSDGFGPPQPLGGESHKLRLGGPSFSSGGRLLLVNRHNAAFPGDLLWYAHIDDPGDPFRGLASFGPGVNGPHIDTNPAAEPDGRTVYFASDRGNGQGGADLWMTTRRN